MEIYIFNTFYKIIFGILTYKMFDIKDSEIIKPTQKITNLLLSSITYVLLGYNLMFPENNASYPGYLGNFKFNFGVTQFGVTKDKNNAYYEENALHSDIDIGWADGAFDKSEAQPSLASRLFFSTAVAAVNSFFSEILLTTNSKRKKISSAIINTIVYSINGYWFQEDFSGDGFFEKLFIPNPNYEFRFAGSESSTVFLTASCMALGTLTARILADTAEVEDKEKEKVEDELSHSLNEENEIDSELEEKYKLKFVPMLIAFIAMNIGSWSLVGPERITLVSISLVNTLAFASGSLVCLFFDEQERKNIDKYVLSALIASLADSISPNPSISLIIGVIASLSAFASKKILKFSFLKKFKDGTTDKKKKRVLESYLIHHTLLPSIVGILFVFVTQYKNIRFQNQIIGILVLGLGSFSLSFLLNFLTEFTIKNVSGNLSNTIKKKTKKKKLLNFFKK